MAVRLSIQKSVGDKTRTGTPAANELNDLKRIQSLLNGAFGKNKVPVAIRAGDAGNLRSTIEAIREFQGLYPGLADGRVDPGGKTLARLNDTVTPLDLAEIQRGKIKHGGYIISYKGQVPPKGYKIFLGTETDKQVLDVTQRKSGDVLGGDNLPMLLKHFDLKRLWGKKVDIRLFVYHGMGLVTRSDPARQLTAPLAPFSGGLGANMLKESALKNYKYSGNKTGRYFHMPPIDGKYYFTYEGKFEIDPTLHGLNCITYVGAVHGISAYTGAMNSYGTKLADAIHATPVDMEAKKEDAIKSFFETHQSGTYVMWSEKHMVIVNSAKVHEFWGSDAGKPGGYRATDIDNWNFHGRTYWVRKTPKDL